MAGRVGKFLGFGDDISRIDRKISELFEEQERNRTLLKENARAIVKIRLLLDNMRKNQEVARSDISDEAMKIAGLRNDFEKEITKIRELQKKAYNQVSSKISDISEQASRQLDFAMGKLKVCCEELEKLGREIECSKNEIAKFNSIASKIKESDFEFKEAAKKIISQDRHKLELMRKIEALKKIISAERRRRR